MAKMSFEKDAIDQIYGNILKMAQNTGFLVFLRQTFQKCSFLLEIQHISSGAKSIFLHFPAI